MEQQDRNRIGTVASLNRYPVKSMAGQELAALELGWTGAVGDRLFAFVRARAAQSVQIDFPWFTGRDFPQLVTYMPNLEDDGSIEIRLPDGTSLPLSSDELRVQLETASGESLFLMRLGRGAYDSLPLSLVSVGSLLALGERLSLGKLAAARFRPNIVIQTCDSHDGVEEEWIGASVTFGDSQDAPRVRVVRPIKRCAMVNIDPGSAQRDARFLKDIARNKANHFGVHAAIEQPGIIRHGDPVWLERHTAQ